MPNQIEKGALSFARHFAELPDPRVAGRTEHRLLDIAVDGKELRHSARRGKGALRLVFAQADQDQFTDVRGHTSWSDDYLLHRLNVSF